MFDEEFNDILLQVYEELDKNFLKNIEVKF